MHPRFLNAEPGLLFSLLLYCLSPGISSSTLLSLPLDPDPGSSQGAKYSPILWKSVCHTPSFSTARSRGGGKPECDLHRSTANRSPIICPAALGLSTARTTSAAHPGAGISLQRYLRDQHDSRRSQASQARRLTSPGYLFALVSPSSPKSASPVRTFRRCACHTPLPPQEGKRACAARNPLAVSLFLTQFATETIMTVNPSSPASPSRRVIRWVLTP